MIDYMVNLSVFEFNEIGRSLSKLHRKKLRVLSDFTIIIFHAVNGENIQDKLNVII